MNQTYSLTNKVAIVTGGGKGLGRTITEYLLAEGMSVAICGRTEKTITGTVDDLSERFGNRLFGAVCDVSDASETANFVQQVIRQFGSVHVLINNSGFGKETRVWETPEAD